MILSSPIFVRHLMRRPLYLALNVVGLAIGCSVCVLALLWAGDELSYDRFHADSDRVCRLAS